VSSNPVRWHAWLGAIVIFLLGLTVGVVGTVLVGVRVVRRSVRTPMVAGGLADRAVGRVARQLTDELQLTPAEAERVRADLEQAAANLRTVRQRGAQDARQEFRAAMLRIGQDLPPEKRQQYREYLRRRFVRAGLGEFALPAGD
jgi:hypothetical protein